MHDVSLLFEVPNLCVPYGFAPGNGLEAAGSSRMVLSGAVCVAMLCLMAAMVSMDA